MSYLGSKAGSGVYQAIIALMPPHDTYVELFAGSGAVLQRKPPAEQSFAVDLDEDALALIPLSSGSVAVCDDAFRFLDTFDYSVSGRVLIYADPPYLHSTRTSRNRYKHELTDEQHFALLQRLLLCPASVILSGYPSEMYDSMLQGWRMREFQAMTRGGVRTEKLWYNFEPTAVHYATYAGRDYTDRQRIKRKAARWAGAFASMPPGERAAVLAAILATDPAKSFPTVHDRYRPQQMRIAVPPALQTKSTMVAGSYSGDRLYSSPLPDSGETKLGPAEGGMLAEARV